MSDEGRTLQMIYQLAQTVDQILRHVRRIEQTVSGIKKMTENQAKAPQSGIQAIAPKAEAPILNCVSGHAVSRPDSSLQISVRADASAPASA